MERLMHNSWKGTSLGCLNDNDMNKEVKKAFRVNERMDMQIKEVAKVIGKTESFAMRMLLEKSLNMLYDDKGNLCLMKRLTK